MKVTFRSDHDPDFTCLERHLASGAFGNLPTAPIHQATHDSEVLQRHVEEFINQSPRLAEELQVKPHDFSAVVLPTRYDSLMKFRILEEMIKRVREAAESMGLDTRSFPHYACIPTGLVNACATTLPCSSRPFLLFDSEIFLYCHLFSKIFTYSLPVLKDEKRMSFSTDINLVRKHIESNPNLAKHLNEVLAVYAAKAPLSQVKRYKVDADYLDLNSTLCYGMELFVVAHEFGHVYSGHLSTILQRFNLRGHDLGSDNISHRHEHEADALGLLLTLKAMANLGYDAALSYVGIELFFISLEMAGRAEHIRSHGSDATYADEATESHPSSTTRRSILRTLLQAFTNSQEQAQNAREMAAHYTEVADLLWEHAKWVNPSFRQTASGGS